MRRQPPRIYHIHPPLAGPLDAWPALLERCQSLGFDHVAVAPPFAPGRRAGVLAPADPDRAHPAFGDDIAATDLVARLADLAGRHQLRLIVDVALHQVASDGAKAGGSSNEELPDPRREPSKVGARAIDFGSEEGQDHLDQWLRRIAALREAGAAAIGVHSADRLPREALGAIAGAVGEGGWVLAYAPDASPDELGAIGRSGVGAIMVPLNERSTNLLKDVGIGVEARLIAAPELPFGRRLASEHTDGAARHRAALQALRLCAGLADGIMVPMGFELAARRSADPRSGSPDEMERLRETSRGRLQAAVKAVNAFLASDEGAFSGRALVELTDPGDPIVAMLKMDAADVDVARNARLVVANRDLGFARSVKTSDLLRMASGEFCAFRSVFGEGSVTTGDRIALDAGGVWIGEATRESMIRGARSDGTEAAVAAALSPRLAIEKVQPSVDGGFPVKRTVGDAVQVEADILADGHEVLRAVLLWRQGDGSSWSESPMRQLGNDRWTASFPLSRVGRHEYAVQAWIGPFSTYRAGLVKKVDAGVPVDLEIEEGRRLVEKWADLPGGDGIAELSQRLNAADESERLRMLLDPKTEEAVEAADPRAQSVMSPPVPVDAERVRAEYASWYEIFPRSQSKEPGRHGTFVDVIDQLPRIRDMGFDVLYFPPIHPIGRKNRKGRNNSLQAGPDDPGSPYAIGSEDGGHDALHPELGTFEDFEKLRLAAAEHGIELAIDFAIQCSPDHPWIKEHPDWFDWRPDGTIKYAENPPKKYEDIVNVDFYAEGAVPSLWMTLRDVVLFWCERGIKLFRVDNPHTKPFPFWEWMIREVRTEHPDAVFLAEAFTRPKIMYRLAKIGYSQSYTYFTWRTRKWEFEEYLTEITRTEVKEFFRPHFFVNTPDINPPYLHSGERPNFLARAALAATLSGLWGVYNGFELCEGRPVPGKEEYLNSEKYEIAHWDYDRPGNITAEITRLNRIRRENPALKSHHGVTFLTAHNDNILFYAKQARGGRNTVVVAVNLAPIWAQEADIELPFNLVGVGDHGTVAAEDLMRGHRFHWNGKWQRVRLEPDLPFAIWRITAA